MYSVQWFDDAKLYEGAFVGAVTEITPTANVPTRCRAARIEFEQLWIAKATESMPRVRRSCQSSRRVFFRFLHRPAREPLIDGIRLPADGLMIHPPGHAYFERTDGPSAFAVMSVPAAGIGLAAGLAAAVTDVARILIPPADALERLRALLDEATMLAEFSPRTLHHPEAARALEQALLAGLADCLAPPAESAAAPVRQAPAMRRFFELLDAAGDQPVHIPDICQALGMAERTFRACCQAYLGISPHAFLLRRRLHLARAALCAPEPPVTVTDVATRFGFWHFGRFACDYRATFGETPSATLRRHQASA